jgi:hypothetical protein
VQDLSTASRVGWRPQLRHRPPVLREHVEETLTGEAFPVGRCRAELKGEGVR